MKREDIVRAYNVESGIWGQTISVEPVRNDVLFIIASDLDSGQSVKVGLSIENVEQLQHALTFAVEDGKILAKPAGEVPDDDNGGNK
jgi:hypothetical protein